MPEDKVRAELIRAIAMELIQNGYRPSPRRGYLQRDGEEPARMVADETWQAVTAIVAERQTDGAGVKGGDR